MVGGSIDPIAADPPQTGEASVIDPITVNGEELVDAGRAVGPFDEKRAENAIRELLIAIGEDPEREGLQDTPGRVARAYQEMFAGLRQAPEEVLTTTFELGHVGYIPSVDGRITGLSKLARLVDVYAKRPQVQERLTTQVADALVRILQPRGVIVVVECEHLCMSMRGIRKPGARTVTSAVRGMLRAPATRAEAMSLILGR